MARSRLGYSPALDGVRGLFMLCFMAYHFGATWLSGAWVGINLFFVLSAFFALFVLFLYGPLSAILILSFQGPDGGLTFPLSNVAVLLHTSGSAVSLSPLSRLITTMVDYMQSLFSQIPGLVS